MTEQQNGPKHPELWEKAKRTMAGPGLDFVRLLAYVQLCRKMGLEP